MFFHSFLDNKFKMLKYPGVKSVICGEAGQHSKLNKVYWQQLYACMLTMDMKGSFCLKMWIY